MASGDKRPFAAVDCAGSAGKYAFGVDLKKAVQLLRNLADDVEEGRVLLHSISTSSHATQDEFAVRELVIEILEESADNKPAPLRRPAVVRD